MDIGRLRRIIEYSDSHKAEIGLMARRFYSLAGMSSEKEVLNIMQIARVSFREKGFLVLEIPLADREIGALCYRGDALGYVVLNTSLPKVNVNFAMCHELYHVFFQQTVFQSRIEFANDHYYEQEEEFAANLFAGMILMPETGFRFMYGRFKEESMGSERDTVLRLMNYYQAPYMAVLIRCYELGLPDSGSISAELLQADREDIRRRFVELWLDESILEATGRNDYPHLEALVEQVGEDCVRDAYLSERTLKRVLRHMGTLYSGIKGET